MAFNRRIITKELDMANLAKHNDNYTDIKTELDAHDSQISTHVAAQTAHGSTSAATAGKIMQRDSSGRAKVAAPVATDDIARKAEVDAVQTNLDEHEADAAVHLSADDRSKLNGIVDGAEPNQNAFTQVNDVVAAAETDTLTIEGGTGITVTTNPTTKKVIVTATGDATPGAHGSSHNIDGADPIPDLVALRSDFDALTPADIGAASTADLQAVDSDVTEKLADIAINVKSFGAKGDGVSDDTEAIQQAIDSASAKGGSVVFIPAGVYAVSGLILKDYVTIQGAGKTSTRLRLINNSNNHVIRTPYFDSDVGTNPSIEKLTKTGSLKMLSIDGNKSNQTEVRHGFAYLGIDLQMEEVEIKNASGFGCWIESSLNIWSVQSGQNLQSNIRHVDVHGNKNGNFYYNGQSDSTIVDIVCYETESGLGQFNFKLGPNAMGVRVIGLHCWGVSDYGVIIEPDSACFTNTHVESAAVAKVWIKKFTVFEGRIYEVGSNTAAPAFLIDSTMSSNRIEAQVFNCDVAVKFNAADGGSGLYDIMMYSPNASAVIFSGSLSSTNFVRARLTGGAQSNIFMSPYMKQVPGSNWDFSTSGNNYAFYTDEAKANRQFGIENTSNANSWIAATGGVGGIGGALLARGSASDIDLRLIPQGSGRVRFGTHVTTADVAITGFIEVKDINGTIRKLAVIS